MCIRDREGTGHVVASLGVESGYVPYTSYSAKTSYLKEYPDVIQKFTNGLQMGMEFVREHTPEEIAQVIAPQFPETDMETLTTIVKRYHEQDTCCLLYTSSGWSYKDDKFFIFNFKVEILNSLKAVRIGFVNVL